MKLMKNTTRRMYTLAELEGMIGATKKTIMSWVKVGIFPAPALRGRGPGKHWWNLAEVEAALAGNFTAGGRTGKR
jgi:hypothetical protein